MAAFGSLFQLGMVLREILEHYGNVAGAELGAPHDGLDHPEGARITLLWTTPQPIHRNDPWERNSTGQLEAPPLTLSTFFMVTTYGGASSGLEGAYNQLSKVLRLVHERPETELPDGSFSEHKTTGSGTLSIVQVPMAADLMEKVFSPLQIKHRPWVLLEVGPVQLVPERDPRPAAAVVRPDGLRLTGPEVMVRPSIERLVPPRVGRQAWIRIDGVWPASVTSVRVGGKTVPPGPTLRQPRAGGPLLVRLPDSVGVGDHRVTVQTHGQSSKPQSLRVLADARPSVGSPDVIEHDPTTDLVLRGHQLGSTTEVALWPDAGIGSPDDVRTFRLANADIQVSPTEIRVLKTALDGASLAPRVPYRVAVRLSPQEYSPYVLLEVSS